MLELQGKAAQRAVLAANAVKACEYDAIHVENGIAVIDAENALSVKLA